MSYWNDQKEVTELVGKTITEVEGLELNSEYVTFYTQCGKVYQLYHEQDCCEDVDLQDFEGDADDIVGGIVLSAEERTNEGDEEFPDKPSEYCESFTWTFYDIQTTKGSLWLRWLGESNGYYSESVYFREITGKDTLDA